jgi:hypothetical protein
VNISVVRPVWPRGTNQLSLDVSARNLSAVSKICQKIQVWLKYDKNNFTQTNVNLWYLTEFFIEWGMFQKKVVEKIKIILHSITFFQKSCYEMMWPRQATNDNIIQHMYFAFQITKATVTLRIRNTYCFSMPLGAMWTCLNVMFTHSCQVLFMSVTKLICGDYSKLNKRNENHVGFCPTYVI